MQQNCIHQTSEKISVGQHLVGKNEAEFEFLSRQSLTVNETLANLHLLKTYTSLYKYSVGLGDFPKYNS